MLIYYLHEVIPMAQNGSTDRVRLRAAQEYVDPARQRGETTVEINSGIFGKSLVANHLLSPRRYPIICQALKSSKFQKENGLTLLKIEAPPTAASGKSSTITFVYRIESSPGGSSSLGGLAQPQSKKDLFSGLRGICSKVYKQLGGAEAFHKAERESWER
jgi:hypothetical protein